MYCNFRNQLGSMIFSVVSLPGAVLSCGVRGRPTATIRLLLFACLLLSVFFFSYCCSSFAAVERIHYLLRRRRTGRRHQQQRRGPCCRRGHSRQRPVVHHGGGIGSSITRPQLAGSHLFCSVQFILRRCRRGIEHPADRRSFGEAMAPPTSERGS